MSKSFWLFSTILWSVLIFRLTTMPQVVTVPDTMLQQLMMSGAHFFFFGVLASFVELSISVHSKNLRKYLPILLVSAYGLVIELVQRGIPGRSADPADWLLDTLGAITFLFILKKLQSKL